MPEASRAIGTLTRNQLFAALFLLAALNSMAGLAIKSVQQQGWADALMNLLGLSAIVWAGLVAGLHILIDAPPSPRPRSLDLWLSGLVGIVALLPIATASMVSLTVLALYGLTSSDRNSAIRRSSIIFLAMTGVLIWGRLVMAVFSRPLLDLDAMFVSGLLGSEHQGNMLWYQGDPTRLVVAPGCSSLQGMSLALLFWAIVNQLFKVPFGWRPALWCLAALAATIGINVLRIGAMLRFPAHLAEIHTGWGFHLSMWATLVAVGLICLFGARREVFRRD